MGNLIANIAFDPGITSEEAYFYIKVAEKLTYRQLILITIFTDIKNSNPFNLRESDYRDTGGSFPFDFISLLQEIFELHNYGLGTIANDTLLGLTDVNPSKFKTIGTGVQLVKLMELYSISESDIEKVVEMLK